MCVCAQSRRGAAWPSCCLEMDGVASVVSRAFQPASLYNVVTRIFPPFLHRFSPSGAAFGTCCFLFVRSLASFGCCHLPRGSGSRSPLLLRIERPVDAVSLAAGECRGYLGGRRAQKRGGRMEKKKKRRDEQSPKERTPFVFFSMNHSSSLTLLCGDWARAVAFAVGV